jgi:MFS family permease
VARSTGAVLGTLSAIVFVRVLGAFLVLVGFVDYWKSLGGSDETSGVGFASYALAMAILLLPLGALSDRLGRRNVVVDGLLLSALGGALAALAPTPLLFALGRFVQGAGAVNGVALAIAGEIGEPERRTRRMAALGAAAGGAVVLGLLGGALLHRVGVGIPAILWGLSVANALLALAAWRGLPDEPARGPAPRDPKSIRVALLLGAAAFAVNFSLAGLLLYAKPLLAAAAPRISYEVALLIMLLPAGLGMFAAARLADRGAVRAVGLVAALLLGATPLLWLWPTGAVAVVLAGVAFFLGHSSLTSLLPSLAARLAPEGRRGFAQGVQSTLQYLGSAAGPSLVGVLYAAGATAALAIVFVASGALVAIVVFVASGAPHAETR